MKSKAEKEVTMIYSQDISIHRVDLKKTKIGKTKIYKDTTGDLAIGDYTLKKISIVTKDNLLIQINLFGGKVEK